MTVHRWLSILYIRLKDERQSFISLNYFANEKKSTKIDYVNQPINTSPLTVPIFV